MKNILMTVSVIGVIMTILILGIILLSGCKFFIEQQGAITYESPQHCEAWVDSGTSYEHCITERFECIYDNNKQYDICIERLKELGVK